MLPVTKRAQWVLAALAICFAVTPALAAPPSGGGSKITVTAATPPDAFQGEELDVIVTGSDSGTQVSYLVAGTADASQVQLISVQYISSTQLKTRIRPKDAALAVEHPTDGA